MNQKTEICMDNQTHGWLVVQSQKHTADIGVVEFKLAFFRLVGTGFTPQLPALTLAV